MYDNRIDDDIAMQECESYAHHKVNNKNKVVLYEECLPADDKHINEPEPTTDDKPVKPVVGIDETPAVDQPAIYEAFTVDDYTSC